MIYLTVKRRNMSLQDFLLDVFEKDAKIPSQASASATAMNLMTYMVLP